MSELERNELYQTHHRMVTVPLLRVVPITSRLIRSKPVVLLVTHVWVPKRLDGTGV